MKTINFKVTQIEGGNEFENYENSVIYNSIINSYFSKKSELTSRIENEIGIKSEHQFEEGSLFSEMFTCYLNDKEIEKKVEDELLGCGYFRELKENEFRYETPTHIMTEKKGKDIGPVDYCVNICNIEIIIK